MLQTNQECSHARASWDGGRGWFADQSSGCTGDTWRASPCCGCCERGVGGWMRCWMSGHSIYTWRKRTEGSGLKEQHSGTMSEDCPLTRDKGIIYGDFIIHLLMWARNPLRFNSFVSLESCICVLPPVPTVECLTLQGSFHIRCFLRAQ